MAPPLIVITSCWRDKVKGCHAAIRETWGKNCQIDYRFIMGHGNTADEPDELVFDVPDDLQHCTYKTHVAHKWAMENGYGYVLQAFIDTYLNITPLLQSNYTAYDYTGLFRGQFNSDVDFQTPDKKGWYAYASGGVGYWTSPKGTKLLAEAPMEFEDPIMSWAEDLWAGTILGRGEAYGHHDDRYRLEANWFLDFMEQGKISSNDIFSMHLGRGTGVYDPDWMRQAHTRMLNARNNRQVQRISSRS